MFIKPTFAPGVLADDTSLAAEGGFVSSDKIRWVRNKAETFRGTELVTLSTLSGKCRGMTSYSTIAGTPTVAIGTNTHLYAVQDGIIYDITPIQSYGSLTNPFTTTISLFTVSVAFTAHGLAIADRIVFHNATAVGGITIDGEYAVTSVTDANTFVITHTVAATSSAGPGGGTVDRETLLNNGLETSTGGSGYGTGGYGSGGYGSPTTGDLLARTWSLSNWGQNLIATPSNETTYEYAPPFTSSASSELVTNGDMATATGWTQGTGWLIAAGVATASAGTASTLSTTITMNPAAYFMLQFDATRTTGTLSVNLGTTAVISAIVASGRQRQVFFSGTGALSFAKSSTFAGTVDNVSVKQLTRAYPLPNSPSQTTVSIVTPERIVMAAGTIDGQTSTFNPLHVRWSDQDVTTAGGPGNQAWTATASNQAGFYTFGSGSRIVGIKNGVGEVLIWTDSALYRGVYVEDPNIVYSWEMVSDSCGLVGANAVDILNGVSMFLTPALEFMGYDTGRVYEIECSVGTTLKDNLSPSQGAKVYACRNTEFGEIIFLYPDARDGAECSRYILTSPTDGWFAIGTYARTAWVDTGAISIPMAVSTTGGLYYQDLGVSDNGASRTWTLQTGSFELGEGPNLFQISAVIPDFKNLQGTISLEVGTYAYPGATRVANGPYPISSTTTKVDMLLTGRQMDMKFTGTGAPSYARFGSPRADVFDTGMMF